MLKEINKSIECDIGEIANKEVRGRNKKNKINQITSLLKRIQKERGITDFNKNWLRKLLIDFSDLKIRNRQRLIKEVLDNAKSQRQRTIKKKYLVKVAHPERKILGELTTSKRVGIDRCWVEKNELSLFFSFL